MKSHLLPIALLLFCAQVSAQVDSHQLPYVQERAFTSELDLSHWCEQEARARYVAKNITPYNWTSRFYNRSNVLYVEGRIRANGEDVDVRCRVAHGARERYAVIEIDDPTLR